VGRGISVATAACLGLSVGGFGSPGFGESRFVFRDGSMADLAVPHRPGKPIAGLYAAGELTGGLNGRGCVSGSSLGKGGGHRSWGRLRRRGDAT
jgi:hypothetical protein